MTDINATIEDAQEINATIDESQAINVTVEGGSGASNFLQLNDTPSAYTGKAEKLVKVNAAEDGLEFADQDAIIDWGEINGTISDQTDLQGELDLKYDATDFDTDWDTRLSGKTTTDLAEGTNLYYTEARVDANSNVSTAYAHVTSDGTDHSYIDQDVKTTASPTFANVSSSNVATANDHIVRLDQMNSAIQGIAWQDAVISQTNFVTSEPATPTTGDRYINTATGDSSETTQAVTATYIYEWNGTDWTETVSEEGAAVWDKALDTNYTFNGTSWVEFGSTITHNNTSGLQGGTTSEYYHLNSNDYTGRWQSDGTYVYNTFGNVGIGTTSPGAKLEIGDGTGSPDLRFNKLGSGISSIDFYNGAAQTAFIRSDAGESFEMGTISTEDLNFYSNNTKRLVISDNGNVGIGTDGSPDWLLDVQGTFHADGESSFDGNVGIGTTSPSRNLHINSAGSGDAIIKLSNTDQASYYSEITNAYDAGRGFAISTQGTDALTIAGAGGYSGITIGTPSVNFAVVPATDKFVFTGGNVGIGTTSPEKKLHIGTGDLMFDNNYGIYWDDSAGATKKVHWLDSNDDIIYKAVNTKDHIFQDSGGNELMRITDEGTTGNVGIGTTSPDTTLDVAGAITHGELSADPADPDEGKTVMWTSDGTGSGDDGDVMMKITAGGTTKTVTLVDFSAA